MKNIKSTKNTNKAITATSNEGYGLGSKKDDMDGHADKHKPLTAWAVEVNGEIDPRDIFPARMWARTMRNDYAEHFPSKAKVSVRKVLITSVKGR